MPVAASGCFLGSPWRVVLEDGFAACHHHQLVSHPLSPCAVSDALGCFRVFGGIFGGRRGAEALSIV